MAMLLCVTLVTVEMQSVLLLGDVAVSSTTFTLLQRRSVLARHHRARSCMYVGNSVDISTRNTRTLLMLAALHMLCGVAALLSVFCKLVEQNEGIGSGFIALM